MQQKKTQWKRWHKVTLAICAVFFFLLIGIINKGGKIEAENKQALIASMTKEQKDSVAKEESAATRKKQIEKNFSSWDGSHRKLVDLVKKSLNDPGSFDHVETKFWDMGDDNIVVLMTYRAKNGFGALVLGSVKAKTNIAGDVVKIMDSQ
jgi:hypothetical protein